MDRRVFLKAGISATLSAGLFHFSHNSLFAEDIPYDLVAVKDGEPDVMFDSAIEAFGGMKKFVKSNQTVVMKPNIGWDVPPERAGNTNPKLVRRIIQHCFNAGAKDVYVFDNTCDNWSKCYSTSGIEKSAKDAGAKVISANNESNYHNIELKNAKKLKEVKVHELILSCDVYINVPILKSHGSGKVTICMKNQMGIVWDRRFWHRNDLHQCIADYSAFVRKPDLNIVDAYNVMFKNGPRGVSVEDVQNMKYLILSKDMVSADCASSKLLGIDPMSVKHIKFASEMGVGNPNLEQLRIKRIKL
jgi:uncharacterized protein (DUF362 family)